MSIETRKAELQREKALWEKYIECGCNVDNEEVIAALKDICEGDEHYYDIRRYAMKWATKGTAEMYVDMRQEELDAIERAQEQIENPQPVLQDWGEGWE